MKLEIVVPFILQHASAATCDQYRQPYGTIEVLDCDGERVAFAQSETEAIGIALDMIRDAGVIGVEYRK